MAISAGEAWRQAAILLVAVAGDPQREAQTLLLTLLGINRARLLAYPQQALTDVQYHQYMAQIRQRAAGLPLPYLLGSVAFYKHEFLVTPDVLIPRPETEHLVEAALAWVQARTRTGQGLTLVDVGTGSGIIALSLAAALPQARVIAVDISPAALAVAQENARRLAVENIAFIQGDLLDALPAGTAPDLLAANLPYIRAGELPALAVAVHEPRLALDGGTDGLDLIRRLVAQAADRLTVPYSLLLEIGADQGEAVCALCRASWPDAAVRIIKDYSGHDRVVVAQQDV